MTRVYQSPDKSKGLRVLIVGAGAYPDAKVAQPGMPVRGRGGTDPHPAGVG